MLINLEKCSLVSDFQYCFRSFFLTVNLLLIAAKRIASGLNMSDTTEDVVFDIWKSLGCCSFSQI